MSIESAVELMNRQDAVAVAAVAAVRPAVVAAIEHVVAALSAGGRLIYCGAGTSGRLGVLDASECPPTFRSDPEQVQGIIAGGPAAMFAAQENAEDRADDGAAAVAGKNVGPADVLIGIAAGGTTPFVRGALAEARKRGAATIFLTCVQAGNDEPAVDLIIRPLTGPEIVSGSTRLKAGTATKLILNQITTISMVRLGKVYQNLMVDLRATNSKLRDRGARIVAELTGLSRAAAMQLLDSAGGEVKTAVVMQRRGVDAEAARELLGRAGGRLRAVID